MIYNKQFYIEEQRLDPEENEIRTLSNVTFNSINPEGSVSCLGAYVYTLDQWLSFERIN
jgi:hypothetical protein